MDEHRYKTFVSDCNLTCIEDLKPVSNSIALQRLKCYLRVADSEHKFISIVFEQNPEISSLFSVYGSQTEYR